MGLGDVRQHPNWRDYDVVGFQSVVHKGSNLPRCDFTEASGRD